MPIQKQLVPVQFGGGVNTKVDSKQLRAGQLLALQDGQFSKQGQINKRYGYNVLGTSIQGGGDITSGIEIATYKDELLLFDGTYVYTYLPSNGNWSNRGTAISITTIDENIIRTSAAQQLNPDMNYLAGVQAFAWEDSRGGVRYAVIDNETKGFAIADAPLQSGMQQPKVISFNGMIYIFFTDGASSLYYQSINPTNPSLISDPVAVAMDGYSGLNGFPYDCHASDGYIYVSYISNSTASGAIQTRYINSSLSISAATVIQNTPGSAINAGYQGTVNVVTDSGNNVWISWGDGIHVHTSCYNSTLTSIVLSDTIIDSGNAYVMTGIEAAIQQTLLLSYEIVADNPMNEQVRYATIAANGSVAAPITIRSVGLASKAFKYNGNIFINTAYQSTDQSTDFTFIISNSNSMLSTPVIVAKETPSIGGGLSSNGMCSETPSLATGVFIFSNNQAGKIFSEANTIFDLLGVCSTQLTFAPTNQFINTTQANTLLVVGGVLQGYDGVSFTEVGFHIYPEDVTYTPSGDTGSLGYGTYQYMTTYAWTDNNGQIYESAPSIPVSVTAVAGNFVTVVVPTLRLTAKTGNRTDATINIYRTAANGTTFNLVTDKLAPLQNNTLADTVTFVDVLSDTAAQSNQLVYTTGNVLANIAPPANSIITTYNNRVFLAGLSDKLQTWYSQTVVDNSNANTVPPQFCAELTIACDPRGGDITALGLLNGALIIFKENEIFALNGNGPDATGNNSDFGDPVLVTSDVGCINANSVVIMPLGLMFQSAKGIYLLDQSSNVTYIGSPVEAFSDLNITASTLIPTANQVIFTTSNGTALVFDYFFSQWSTWSNHPAADCTFWQDNFVYLRTTGQVYVQSTSTFTDAGVPIFLSWTLPNLSFAGLQGFQRVFRAYILGSYIGPHTLDVSVAYDFDQTYTQFATVTPSTQTSIWGSDSTWGASTPWGSTYQIYEFRIDFNVQKCTSIRLSVSDNQTSNYNEGYSISSVTFEVGILPGGNRLPTTNTYGAQ